MCFVLKIRLSIDFQLSTVEIHPPERFFRQRSTRNTPSGSHLAVSHVFMAVREYDIFASDLEPVGWASGPVRDLDPACPILAFLILCELRFRCVLRVKNPGSRAFPTLRGGDAAPPYRRP